MQEEVSELRMMLAQASSDRARLEHQKVERLNPKPETRDSKPQTPNPKPQTPQPET